MPGWLSRPNYDKTMNTLAERIQYLIERSGKSIHAIAAAMGLEPSTLHRIATGSRKHPRRTTLAVIAKFFGASEEWLLTGKGESPSKRTQIAESLEWSYVVEQLGLTDEAAAVLAEWPNFTEELINNEIVGKRRDLHFSIRVRLTPDLEAARLMEWRMWSAVFREWMRLVGVARVRQFVEEHPERFQRTKPDQKSAGKQTKTRRRTGPKK